KARVDPVSQTGMQSPREIPLRGCRCGSDTERRRICIDIAGDGVAREANAGADERRHAPPGSEIHIGVGQSQPFRLAGGVSVNAGRRYARIAEDKNIASVEIGFTAILAGDVGAKPVVELVTDADAKDTCGVKA